MSIEKALRAACSERCAEYGDAPCYELDRCEGVLWTACSKCLSDVGEEAPPEPIDPAAVIAPLF